MASRSQTNLRNHAHNEALLFDLIGLDGLGIIKNFA